MKTTDEIIINGKTLTEYELPILEDVWIQFENEKREK